MDQKSREKDQDRLGACRPGERTEKKGQHDLALRPKAHWPAGLQMPPAKDVTCFIPENLAVVLSRNAFEQLFGYVYSTTSEICCLGTVKREGERFRVERFYLVPQSGSAGHTELDQGAVAALVEGLIAQGKGDEAHSLTCCGPSRSLTERREQQTQGYHSMTINPPGPISASSRLVPRRRRPVHRGQAEVTLALSRPGPRMLRGAEAFGSDCSTLTKSTVTPGTPVERVRLYCELVHELGR